MRGPANSSPAPSPPKPTANSKSASATAIATNSTATTKKLLIAAGLRITGRTPDENYVEIVEAPEHPWFLGCQFHPEFKSKPLEPHPLFAAFIGAALEHKKNRSRPAAEVTARPSRRRGPARHRLTLRAPGQLLLATRVRAAPCRIRHRNRVRFAASTYVIFDQLRMIAAHEIPLDSLRLGGGNPLFLIAGPCVIESESHARKMAERIAKIAADAGVPYIFKASYDKANRSSVKAFRGPGLKEGLRILGKIKSDLEAPHPHRHSRTRPKPHPPPKSATCCKSPRSSRAKPIC